MENYKIEYEEVDTDELTRAKDHQETFPYTDTADCEATNESYKKFKRIYPVVYVVITIDGQPVKSVIDGWRYVAFARANGINKIYACHLTVDNKDDLLDIMIQLQRTNHQTYLALYFMIKALWEKHHRGQGYRSDLSEADYEKPVLGADGKRMTIYDRIGRDLQMKGYKVMYIKKIGDWKPLQFIQMDTERLSLRQIYKKCCDESTGKIPGVPAVKPVIYHSTNTGAPKYTAPTSTADAGTTVDYDQPINGDQVTNEKVEDAGEIPIGRVVSVGDEYIIVCGICQYCGKETFLKIPINQIT